LRGDFRAELLFRAVDPRDDEALRFAAALRDDFFRLDERLLADDFRPRALLEALRAAPRDDDRDEPRRPAFDFDPLRFDRLDEREVLRDLLVFVAMS
jgi:hypothetical protein